MKKCIHVLLVFVLLLNIGICACAPSEVVYIMPGIQSTALPAESDHTKIPVAPDKTFAPIPSDAALPTAKPFVSEYPSTEQNSAVPAPETPAPQNTETPLPPETAGGEPENEPNEPSETPAPAFTQKPFTAGKNNIIYLTFDDGPCKLTMQLLDTLDKYNVKATFFTVGYFVDRYPEIIREAASRGHLIACHTYSHDFNKIYKSAAGFMNDVHEWEDSVIRALGALPPKLCIRLPGGSNNTYLSSDLRSQIVAALESEGYCWYDWDFGDNDKWLAGNTDNLPVNEYLMRSYLTTLRWIAGTEKPLIFLAHDTCNETVNIIGRIIEDMIARGFTFSTLQDCPFSHLEM